MARCDECGARAGVKGGPMPLGWWSCNSGRVSKLSWIRYDAFCPDCVEKAVAIRLEPGGKCVFCGGPTYLRAVLEGGDFLFVCLKTECEKADKALTRMEMIG